MFGSCVQSTWGLPTSPKHWNVSQQHPVVQKLMYVHQQHCVFFPEVAQMGLYDDACYPLAVLHWKKCDCRKNMETSTCDKKMRDVGSKATTRTNSEMGLNHGISTSTLIGMQLQNKNINQTT